MSMPATRLTLVSLAQLVKTAIAINRQATTACVVATMLFQ
jgi:hypothetical protein